MNVQVNKKSLSITGIYHPPQKDRVTNSMFSDDITDYLNLIVPTTESNLMLGDFNIHVDDVQDNDALAFNNTMMVLGLDQCVNSSRHTHGNKLDLVYAEAASDLAVSLCIQVYLFQIIRW